MTQNQTLNGALDTRLNHLYWSTDRTVEQILNDLSLARSALYASIEPVPAGMACSSCGEVVVFTNRTNRASGSGVCRGCGAEARVPREAAQTSSGADRESHRSWSRWREELQEVEPERAMLIGAAAICGVVLGTAAARTLRG